MCFPGNLVYLHQSDLGCTNYLHLQSQGLRSSGLNSALTNPTTPCSSCSALFKDQATPLASWTIQSTILLLTTTLKLLKLYSTAHLTPQLEFLLSSLLYVLHHMPSGLTLSQMLNTGFLQHRHTTPHYFSSVLPLWFHSRSFNNSTSDFKSTFSYPTETNFPFPNCNRLVKLVAALHKAHTAATLT